MRLRASAMREKANSDIRPGCASYWLVVITFMRKIIFPIAEYRDSIWHLSPTEVTKASTVRDPGKASQLWALAGAAPKANCQLMECDVSSEMSIIVLSGWPLGDKFTPD